MKQQTKIFQPQKLEIHHKDLAAMQRGLLRNCIGLAVLIGAIWLFGGYMATWLLLLCLAGAVGYLAGAYGNWIAAAQERALLIAFKGQTRSIFIGSQGVSELYEDDNEIKARMEFCLEYLKRSGNTHRLKVYVSYFRDAVFICYKLNERCEVVKINEIVREGITVNESREKYRMEWEFFQAKELQADLVAARMNTNAIDWVDEQWFGQSARAAQLFFD